MRTTVTIDEHLLKQAKELAVSIGKTLSEVIEEALAESLARRRRAQARERVVLPTFTGDGLLPGVDLANSASLLDIMEADDPLVARR